MTVGISNYIWFVKKMSIERFVSIRDIGRCPSDLLTHRRNPFFNRSSLVRLPNQSLAITGRVPLARIAYALSSTQRDIVLKFRVVATTFSFRSKKLLLNFESLCFVAYNV